MNAQPTILIVDDDEGHAILIRENLEAAGLSNRIRHFRDGQAILDFFFKDHPAPGDAFLVLLDIRMPKVDGIEVLREVKSNQDTKTLPVVMLTSSAEERDMVATYSLGVNSYIVKPVDIDQFVESVRQIGLYWMVLNQRPGS